MIRNTIIILICSIIAKILSYVWEALIASYLGISENADAFYMCSGIFNILYPMLDLGIWKVFMPIYKQNLTLNNQKTIDKIANISVTLFLCFSILLVAFFIIFAEPLVAIMAPGFNVEKQVITIEYLRIGAIAYLLMAVSTVISAMLQSHECFIGYQMREFANHLSKIIYVCICYHFLGIYAAVTAVIIGSIFRLIIQIPFINWKWNFNFNFSFTDPDILPMIKGLPSVAITAAITQINAMVGRIFASASITGSVACLNYGNKLLNVFSGMISGAIAAATYPRIIQFIAEKRNNDLSHLVSNLIIALSFIIVPMSFFCGVFSKDIVQIAFQRGSFDNAAVQLTSSIFAAYCLGMLFVGLTNLVTNIFYAFGDIKITLYISIFDVILNIFFNFLLYPVIGVVGVAASASFSAILSFSVRMLFINNYIRLDFKYIIKEIGKIIFVSLIAVGLSRFFYGFLLRANLFLLMFCVSFIALILFLVFSFIFKLSAIVLIKRIILKKFIK